MVPLDTLSILKDTYLAMHSFLIVGHNRKSIDDKLDEIIKRFSLKKIDFSGQKIEDIRNLNSFVSLSLKEKTAIVLKNIENSTNEALNAFLKNLEEPQKNLFFLLTSSSIHKVLPTIISRCQIIYTSQKRELVKNEEVEKFIKMDTAEKFSFFDRMRKREDAISFFQDLIFNLHRDLINSDNNLNNISNTLENAQKTLSRLEMNGNVNLQLTNFVVNTDNFDSLMPLVHEV